MRYIAEMGLVVMVVVVMTHYVYGEGEKIKGRAFRYKDVSGEKRLVADLRRRYISLGTAGRPVWNASHPVAVKFGLGLIKMDLKEKEHMLVLSTWTRYMWRDEYLEWDADDYEGMLEVKVHNDMIWRPDVMLYNTATTDESSRGGMAVVRYDGVISYYPHQEFSSSCSVDVRNYPFDNQTCHLWFGSWAHPLTEVDLDLAFPSGIDLSTFMSVYKDASEWEITNTSASRQVVPEEGQPQFVVLTMTLNLKRRMMFSSYILTIPAILLSFTTLIMFCLPREDVDRTSLGLTIFGSLLLLLLILVEAAPPTASAIPLLGVYYCFTSVIVILSIFLSSLVLKIRRAKEKPVPSWVRLLILRGLATLLCMGTGCRKSSRDKQTGDVVNLADVAEDSHYKPVNPRYMKVKEKCTNYGSMCDSILKLEERLGSLQMLLDHYISTHAHTARQVCRQAVIDEQWQTVAAILDRLFFCLYLVAIVVGIVTWFPRWW